MFIFYHILHTICILNNPYLPLTIKTVRSNYFFKINLLHKMEFLCDDTVIEMTFQHWVIEESLIRAIKKKQHDDLLHSDLVNALRHHINHKKGAASRLNEAYVIAINTYDSELDVVGIRKILSEPKLNHLEKTSRFISKVVEYDYIESYYINITHILLNDVNTDDFVLGHISWEELCTAEIDGSTDEEFDYDNVSSEEESGITSDALDTLPLQQQCQPLLKKL